MPRASAVLVRDGNILEVGEPERMQPWLEGQQFRWTSNLQTKSFARALLTRTFTQA